VNPTRELTGCGVRQVAKRDGVCWRSSAIWMLSCKEEEEELMWGYLVKGYPSLLASDLSSSPAKLDSCVRIGEPSRQ